MGLFAKDYDSVQVGGSGKALPPGGYVCRILKAKLTKTKDKGNPMVEAIVDIVDGEYAQYFSKRYDENKEKHGKEAKYPNNGILRVVAADENGKTKRNFKSFVTAIEESNQMEVPKDNDEAFIKAITGKEIGILFGREEFIGGDGKTHFSTKPRWYRSVETIINGEFDTPKDQLLDNSYYPSATDADLPDSFSAIEDSIPF